jgi:hypothetical protein
MKSIRSADARRAPAAIPGLDAEALIAAATQGVHQALARHKAQGRAVVIWRDGRIVHLRPESIDI